MKLNFLLTLLIVSAAMFPLFLRLPQVNKALSKSGDPAAVTQRGSALQDSVLLGQRAPYCLG